MVCEHIARQLGVSLTPVRHAIQQLATEGLIEIRPRSGTFVASLNISDSAETFDIRVALECLAAEKAVVNATAAKRITVFFRNWVRPNQRTPNIGFRCAQ